MPKPRSYLATLVQETHRTEAEVVAMAFETGLRQLWRERVLGRYLRGQIPRDEVIESPASTGSRWRIASTPPCVKTSRGLWGSSHAVADSGPTLFVTPTIVDLAIEQLRTS